MPVDFKIIDAKDIFVIIPFLQKLSDDANSEAVLQERLLEMVTQNYECIGVYKNGNLIGVCGLWFMTRHYVGKSVEIDHLYIEKKSQGQGLGKIVMEWVDNYAQSKGCKASELNTYVQNYPSHKFYYNQGYEIKGYHFLKKF